MSTRSHSVPTLHAELRRQPDSAPFHRALEVAGIVGAAGLVASLLHRVLAAVAGACGAGASAGERWLALAVLLCIPAGYLAADLVSGAVHWAFDRFGSADTPFFGPRFVAPFRRHHEAPEEIVSHGFVETNGNNFLAALLPLAGVSLLRIDVRHPGQLLLASLIAFTALFSFGTNQFHKWAHAPEPPPIARWLQARRLILRPEHHAVHHAPPHDSNYCITAGWMDAPLARLRLWARAEWFAERVLRVTVHRH